MAIEDEYSEGKTRGARKALAEAAERFEENPDETLTGAEAAARLRAQANEL